MNTPSQAGMLPVPLKMGLAVQLFVLLCILASAVTITRSIVQGTLPVISKGMEHVQGENHNRSVVQGNLPVISEGIEHVQGENHSECFTPAPADSIVALEYTELQGYIVSNQEIRYNNSKNSVEKLGIQAHQYVPIPYNSEQIRDAVLAHHNGSTQYSIDEFFKVFSNRLTFKDLFQKFVDDRRAGIASWRFFFEDDVQLHPDLENRTAQEVLAKGMKIAAGDGIMYLGICVVDPKDCQDRTMLSSSVEASKCWGACTHAFALTKWRAEGFLSYMDQIKAMGDEKKNSMYLDQLLLSYGKFQVRGVWVLGSNLTSPQHQLHFGLLFQDRKQFPSLMNGGWKK